MGKKKATSNGAAISSTDSRLDGQGTAPRTETTAPGDGQGSDLGHRREKVRSRTRALEAAEHEVTRLGQELDQLAHTTREQESALAAATARVAHLEQVLVASDRRRAELQAALEGVRADVDRARGRLAAAERKYDRAVLQEVVRREKAVDLALHST